MAIAVIITLMTIIGWMVFAVERAKKDVANVSFAVILAVTWITYYGLKMDKSFKPEPAFMNLLVLPIVLIIFYYIRSETKPKESVKILATRQSYWGITENQIRQKYANRLIVKDDRIEAAPSLNLLFYRILPGVKLITGNLIYDIDRFLKQKRYTVIKEVKELEKYPLYNLIFKKITAFIAYKEIKIDYEAALRDNGGNAEFFLMQLWEEHTQGFNIGTANLDVLANRSIEKHLIAALDAIDMESIRRDAAPLFFAYMEAKGRLPEPEKEPEPETSNSSDEDEDF